MRDGPWLACRMVVMKKTFLKDQPEKKDSKRMTPTHAITEPTMAVYVL